jgi:hypothetical protein
MIPSPAISGNPNKNIDKVNLLSIFKFKILLGNIDEIINLIH